MLTVSFLVIIAPLTAITYSVEKMESPKAQILNTWIKEFTFNVIMQPFHCIMYLTFIDAAFALLIGNGSLGSLIANAIPISVDSKLANSLLAILTMLFIKDGEKIIRKIFNFGEASTVTPLETSAMAGNVAKGGRMLVEGAKNARQGINYIKEKGGSIKNGVSQIGDNMKANSRAKDILKKDRASGGNMTKTEAKTKAISQVSQEKKARVQEINQAKANAREARIEKLMRKDLGNENYERLKASDSENDKKTFNNARERASEKVEKRSLSGVKKKIDKARNSEPVKFIRNLKAPIEKNIAAGVAMAIGAISLAGGDVDGAIRNSSSIYKGMQDVFKVSSNELSTDAAGLVENNVSNKEQLKEKFINVYNNGENYSEDSEKTKELIRDLENALSCINKLDYAEGIKFEISKELLKSPKDFDLDGILQKYVGKDYKDENLQEAASAYAIHKKEGYLYERIKVADAMGIDVNSLINFMNTKLSYNSSSDSKNEFKENINVETQTPNQNNDSSVNHIVTNIQKSENIEEIINKIDLSDYERAIKKIEEHLNELKTINNKSENTEQEISKMNNAVIKFKQMKDLEEKEDE
mgnify:CR=1 FL=1